MLGTSRSSEKPGGIWAVTNVYRESGLFIRWPIVYLATHKTGSKLSKTYVAIFALLKLAYLLGAGRVSLIHVHSASRASLWRKSLFMLLAFISRCPVIFHLHGAEFRKFYEQECGRMAKWYVRFILDRASRIVVLSSQWKAFVSNISTNRNIVCIFNPVGTNSLPDSAQRAHGQDLLFLGRLGKRKGIFDLLQALVALQEDFPNIGLKCGGDGELEEVALQARRLGISHSVHILGWVTGDSKKRLLRNCNLYVLPSYDEGLPVSVLEAMAAALPVVSTPVGGIPEAIEDGVEGYLVPPGDIDALAQALRRLLSDPQLRLRMGLAGRKKIEAYFTPDRVMPQIEALYRELGANPRI